MPKYVSLVNWTQKGVAGFKETVNRAEVANQLAAAFGGAILEIYWTMGPHDIVVISEAPDDESASAFALTLAAQGNLTTITMRAWDAEEMTGIIAKTG